MASRGTRQSLVPGARGWALQLAATNCIHLEQRMSTVTNAQLCREAGALDTGFTANV